MAEVRVKLKKLIGRPVEVVRAHFFDIAHHERHPVHGGARFRVLEQAEGHCVYAQDTALGPFTLRERSRIERSGDGLVNRCLEGPSAGQVATFSFRNAGEAQTEVELDLVTPATGLMRLAAPLLRAVLASGFARALEEDRVDLEERGYPRP
jgi:hypothetical protein